MKNILIVTLTLAIITLFGFIAVKGFDRQEQVACQQHAHNLSTNAHYYLTNWQFDMCLNNVDTFPYQEDDFINNNGKFYLK